MNESVPEILKRIGAALKGAREAKGLTQEGVGSLIGREHPAVSRIERGDSTHSGTLAAIADALGLELFVRPKVRSLEELAQRQAEEVLEAIAAGTINMDSLSPEIRLRVTAALAYGVGAVRAS